MSQKKIDILMFNMSSFSDWQDGIVNRNFCIYKNLKKLPQVENIIAIDFLPIKLKQAVKYYSKNLLLGQKNKDVVFGDLTSLCYKFDDKTYVYSCVDAVWSRKTVIKEINKIISKLKLSNDLITWSYNPLFTEFIGKIDSKLFIFDTVDNWTENKEYLKLISKQKLKNNYTKISQKADIIFTVSNELLDFYKNINREKIVHWVPNGVDFEHFTDTENLRMQTELDDENKQIIGYLGTIQSRVDIDLIKFVAEKNQDKIIALCGPVWKSVQADVNKKLEPLKNIKLFGRIHNKLAPAYINKFDVCIIPHKIDKFTDSMNPMKMYDYLAQGKPIVSTEGAGITDFKDVIYIANTKQEFNNFIQEAFVEGEEIKIKRQEIAKQQDWQNRINKIIKIVQARLG